MYNSGLFSSKWCNVASSQRNYTRHNEQVSTEFDQIRTFMRTGVITSCTRLLAGTRPHECVTDSFSHGLNPASVIRDGVTQACLPVPASPWETLAEVLLPETNGGLVQELTCCCLDIWLSQSAIGPLWFALEGKCNIKSGSYLFALQYE